MDVPLILSRPEFWAVYYWRFVNSSDSPLEQFFGVTGEQATCFYLDCLVHPEGTGTQTVQMPLFDGYSFFLDFIDRRSDDGEDDGDEQDYFLSHEAWGSPELIGYDGGDPYLPALRWAEVDLISRAVLRSSGDALAAATTLLLLYKAAWLTDEENEWEVSERLRWAWRTLSYVQVNELDRMVINAVCGQKGKISWRRDSDLGWVNNGMYSMRNPTRKTSSTPRIFLRMVEFLAAAEARAANTPNTGSM